MVQNRCEILVEPEPGVDMRELRAFLLERVLAELLRLRGRLLLHASGVVLRGGVVAIAGRSGLGKSTLAAVLHTRGHPVIADDLISIQLNMQGGTAVHSGVPELQLLPDAVAFLGDTPELSRTASKHPYRVSSCCPDTPFPLRCIYVLTDEVAPGRQKALPPGEAVLDIVRNSYGAQAIQGTEGLLSHFRQSVALVTRVPVIRLGRPRSLHELPRLARYIEATAEETPATTKSPPSSRRAWEVRYL